MAFNICYASNVSSEFITAAEWSSSVLGERNRVNGVIMAVVLTIFLVIGAFLNLAVIVSIVKKKLFSQPTFLLLLNLSVTDFLFCATVMPFDVVTGFAGEFVFGSSDLVRCRVCKVGVIITILAFLSLHSVALISVDRLLFIKKPLHYHKIVTIERIVVIMVLTWCACIGISLPPIFGIGQINYIQDLFHCAFDFTSHNVYIIVLVGEALVQLLALVISSLWVALIAQKHLKQIYRTGDQQESANHHQVVKEQKSKHQFHLIRVFGAIIIANILTWIPIMALAVVATIVENKFDIPIEYKIFSYLCFLFQPVVHPLLEASLISEIEFPFLKCLRPCWRRRKLRLHEEETCGWRCGLWMGFNSLRVGCVDRECVCRVCGLLDACSVAALTNTEEEEVVGSN